MADNNDLLISLGRLAHFKENLAPVAITGSYGDLTDKPSIPTVPTAVSAFANDAGYITEVQAAEVAKLKKAIVETLPDPGDADENTIYLILAEGGGDGDIYDEYLLIDGSMEKIGSTRLDLSGMLTTDDLATNDDIDAMFEE